MHAFYRVDFPRWEGGVERDDVVLEDADTGRGGLAKGWLRSIGLWEGEGMFGMRGDYLKVQIA